MAKKSFWQKLTGAVKVEDDYEEEFEDFEDIYDEEVSEYPHNNTESANDDQIIESAPVMELPIDLYHDQDNIYIDAFIPGVPISNINVELSREVITISGERSPESAQEPSFEYITQELSWGEFSRTLQLPEEVDIDTANAVEATGVLKITLPKFNKTRKTKLNVRSVKK